MATFRPPRTTSLGSVPARRSVCLMLVSRTADRPPILLQHRVQDLQTRVDREFHQLRAGIDEDIDEGKMTLRQ
jgi:hypothetical protein